MLINSITIAVIIIVALVLGAQIDTLIRKWMKVDDREKPGYLNSFHKRGSLFILALYFIIWRFFFEDNELIVTIIFFYIFIGFTIYTEWKNLEDPKVYKASILSAFVIGVLILVIYCVVSWFI